jgi:hypothetical protein
VEKALLDAAEKLAVDVEDLLEKDSDGGDSRGGDSDSDQDNSDDDTPLPDENPTSRRNTKSAYNMLQDMRWVYKNVRGRDKLKKLVKSDDRQFVTLVKELMKIETALLTAKLRQEATIKAQPVTENNQFFVVLKGLEDAPVKQISGKGGVGGIGGNSKGAIDIQALQRSTDPSAEALTDEEVLDIGGSRSGGGGSRDAPDMMFGRVDYSSGDEDDVGGDEEDA